MLGSMQYRVPLLRGTNLYPKLAYDLGTAPTQEFEVLFRAIYNHSIFIIQLLVRGGSTQPMNHGVSEWPCFGRGEWQRGAAPQGMTSTSLRP